MGIDKLWGAIKEEDCVREIPLSDLRELIKTDRCRIAIDSAWMAQGHFRSGWTEMIRTGRGSVEGLAGTAIATLTGLDNRLRSNGFETTWCFDGDRNPHKLATGRRSGDKEKKLRPLAKRYKLCQKMLAEAGRDESVLAPFKFMESQLYLLEDDVATNVPEDATVAEHLSQLKKDLLYCAMIPPDFMKRVYAALTAKGVHCLRVPSISEGEKLACVLIQQGFCQAVHCNDGDAIALGARCVIKQINGSIAKVYRYQDVIDKFGMDHQRFIHFCIVCGTDFNTHVDGIGAIKAKKLLDDPNFDIYEYNQQNFGCLRINRCISEFIISTKDHEDTLAELARLEESREKEASPSGVIGGDDDEEIIP